MVNLKKSMFLISLFGIWQGPELLVKICFNNISVSQIMKSNILYINTSYFRKLFI